jgi:hypothetical protein
MGISDLRVWIVVFSIVNTSIFTLPPYNFTISQVGLISISPFIMTLIGEAVSGPLNDCLCLLLAKKNHGYAYPQSTYFLAEEVSRIRIYNFRNKFNVLELLEHSATPILTCLEKITDSEISHKIYEPEF